jgi:hypothetical protein
MFHPFLTCADIFNWLSLQRVDSYGPTAMGRTWKDHAYHCIVFEESQHGSIGPHGPGRGLNDESYKIIKASSLAA